MRRKTRVLRRGDVNVASPMILCSEPVVFRSTGRQNGCIGFLTGGNESRKLCSSAIFVDCKPLKNRFKTASVSLCGAWLRFMMKVVAAEPLAHGSFLRRNFRTTNCVLDSERT